MLSHNASAVFSGRTRKRRWRKRSERRVTLAPRLLAVGATRRHPVSPSAARLHAYQRREPEDAPAALRRRGGRLRGPVGALRRRCPSLEAFKVSFAGEDTRSFAHGAGLAFRASREGGAGGGWKRNRAALGSCPNHAARWRLCAIPDTGGAGGCASAEPLSSVRCAATLAPFSAPRNGGNGDMQLVNPPHPPHPGERISWVGGVGGFFPFSKFSREREKDRLLFSFFLFGFSGLPSRALPSFEVLNASPAHRAKLVGERGQL